MATKMMLVPATSESSPMTGFHEDEDRKSANTLENEMKRIIDSKTLPDDRKLKLYHELMGRMLRYMDKSRGKALPVQTVIQPAVQTPAVQTPQQSDDMDAIIREIPESSQSRARRLLKHIGEHMTWDGEQRELTYKGRRIPLNEAKELVRDVVSSRRPRSQQEHLDYFMQALKETGAPEALIRSRYHQPARRAGEAAAAAVEEAAAAEPPTAPSAEEWTKF